ncbi:ComEC/Rec2 family competence protein [Georgenia sp. MJ173]|uniref:ComEC/Rec2 family competence protein n=1 Tax=Georgenia sunbinii TaxID=3117728 RepID=UPI002F263DCC
MSPPSALDVRIVPAAVGCWAVAFGMVGASPTVGVVSGVAVAAGGGGWWLAYRLRRQRARYRAPPAGRAGAPAGRAGAAAALALAAMVLVALATAAHVHVRSTGLLAELAPRGAVVTVVGTVVGDPRPVATDPSATWGGDERAGPGADRFRTRVRVEQVEGRGRLGNVRTPVLVLGPAAWSAAAMGEEVRASGRLVAVEPGDDVAALLVVGEPPVVTAAAPAHQRLATAMRRGLLEAVADASPQARGLVPGIAVGDDTAMPAELDAAMKTVSLTHITAVSGAHVAIILGVVLGALTWTPRWLRATVGGVVLVAFVVLVRPEASVLRSATMGAVALGALLVGRPARALPALGGAVVVLLVVDPWLARSYGFVLSVLATGGLVVLAGPWAARLSQYLPGTLAHVVAVPAAAQVCCAPVIILLEPAIATYAVPANVLAAPAVPPATVLGVLATVCAPWWPGAAAALVVPATWATAWIAGVATVTAGMPGARLGWLGGAGGALLLAALTVVVLVALSRPRGWWLLPAVAVVAIAVVPGPRAAVGGWLGLGPPDDWVAAQCDVGQGSAFLLRTGPHRAVMLDVGPPGPAAGRCLDELRVRELDLLVLSHLHADHVGGLDAVLAGRHVHRALLSPHDAPTAAERRVVETLAAAGVALERPVAGAAGTTGPAPSAADDARHLAGSAPDPSHSAVPLPPAGPLPADQPHPADGLVAADWFVLWPTDRAVAVAAPGDDAAANDLSLALLVQVGDLVVLAPGDVEPAGQRGLLRSWAEQQARSPTPDVVLVPHHGSAAHLPDLAPAFAPRLAVVSVGADNDFGHPAAPTLAAYRDVGALVLRTDECGLITLHRHSTGVAVAAGCDPG